MIAIVHKAASEIRLHLTVRRAVVTVLHVVEEMREAPCQPFRLNGAERRLRSRQEGSRRNGGKVKSGRPKEKRTDGCLPGPEPCPRCFTRCLRTAMAFSVLSAVPAGPGDHDGSCQFSFQNAGVNSTRTVNSSRRPTSMRKEQIHLAKPGSCAHDIVGPISMPRVGRCACCWRRVSYRCCARHRSFV